MRRLIVRGAALSLALLFGAGAALADCQKEPSETAATAEAFLRKTYAGRIFVVPDGRLDKEAKLYFAGCYELAETARNRKVFFAFNAHSDADNPSNVSYVGLQIIKIWFVDTPPKPEFAMYRNTKRSWYLREFSATEPLSAYDDFSRPGSIEEWNEEINADLAWGTTFKARMRKFDQMLGGTWHAAARLGERSAWDRRGWWKVNPGLAAHRVVVDNRLISFERPQSDPAPEGVRFPITFAGADAVIVRYYSETIEDTDIRFCIARCDEIAKMQITP